MDSPLLRRAAPALVVVLVFAAFFPALGAGFVNYDDPTNFHENPHYRGLGPEQLRWMWTNLEGHYMPLTWMTLGLDYELWGMNPRGYHFTNVVLHALAGVLAYVFLLGLFRRGDPTADAGLLRFAALAGALFFAIHPLRAESVAWITERRDVVCGVFFLGSLIAYLRAVPEDGGPARRGPLALSILLFGASLLGKPISLPLPFVLVILDVFPLRRLRRGDDGRRPWARVLGEKVPFLLLTAGALALTILSTEEAGSFQGSDMASKVMSPGYRLLFYVSKTLVPLGLSVLYPYRPVESVFELKYLGAAVGALGITLLLLRHRSRVPAVLAAWLAFALLLGPFLGLVQAGPHFAADRYTYLASIPVAALVGALLLRARTPGSRRAALAGASAVAALLLALTMRQSSLWTDSDKLWTQAIEVDPSYVAHNNRGTARAAAGRHAEAIADFEAALRIMPSGIFARVNRSESLRRLGRIEESLAEAEAAIRERPDYGYAWLVRAEVRMERGDVPGAEEDYSRALAADPVLLRAYTGRAVARGMQGKLDLAIADCTLALRIHPHFVQGYLNRAVARIEKDDLSGGVEDFQRAIALVPDEPDAWAGLGIALSLQNRWADAAEHFRQAIRLAGNRPWPRRMDTQRRLQDALKRGR